MAGIKGYVAMRIRDLRNAFNSGDGLSQARLAEMLGVNSNTISRWETGNYKPSIDDLEKLARAFGVPIAEFFPKSTQESETDNFNALFRAIQGLDDKDIEEVKRYAEFRRARTLYERGARPSAGRKPKK